MRDYRTRTLLAAGLLCVLAATVALHNRARLHVTDITHTIPADGRDHRIATLTAPRFSTLHPEDVQSNSATTRLEANGDTLSLITRAPVIPTHQTLRLTWHNRAILLPITFTADTAPNPRTPGLPDWMPLHTAADRAAFRAWFTALADHAADAPTAQLPPELADCAALLRYSFREALRQHDDRWYAGAPVLERITLPSVTQWSYPNTPLGTGLFRTLPGSFTPADIPGAFAQFADAKTLVAANTFFVSRDLRRARPGDLIFYRLLELDSHHHSQYHSMIVTGDHAEWVVYHTGPVSAPNGTQTKGEIRRVLLRDLLHHPDPRWRPEPANPNFLGVYRWDILNEDP